MDMIVMVWLPKMCNTDCNHISQLLDTDECLLSEDSCEQECVNTIGSYFCTCINGFVLAEDGHSCSGRFTHLQQFHGVNKLLKLVCAIVSFCPQMWMNV